MIRTNDEIGRCVSVICAKTPAYQDKWGQSEKWGGFAFCPITQVSVILQKWHALSK